MHYDPASLPLIIEAILMAAGNPMSVQQLEALFTDEERPAREEILKSLQQLQQTYSGRGMQLVEVASGFRMQVQQQYAPWVSRMWEEKPARYSRALLETLSLIAYRQPVTRGEIEEVRGVAVSSNIIKTLMEREWIRVVGHKDVPGRPALYATTKQFLNYFNLKGLDELPTLSEIRDLDLINWELDLADRAPQIMLPASDEEDAEEIFDDAPSEEPPPNTATH